MATPTEATRKAVIIEMIAAAQEHRAKQEQELQNQREKRRRDAIDGFSGRVFDLFGELTSWLDMDFDAGDYDDSAHATFTYHDRVYRLRDGRYGWRLTRLDPREDGDDRELPNAELYANYHNDLSANQDALLLALDDLANQPEAPASTRHKAKIDDAPKPRICNEFEASLLDALRQFLQSEI